jgi:hypothetical protein
MGLANMIRRALMPPQPNGGIKKKLAQANKERAERVVRVKSYVRTLKSRETNYRRQSKADVRRLAAQIKADTAKRSRKPASSGKKKSTRRAAAQGK